MTSIRTSPGREPVPACHRMLLLTCLLAAFQAALAADEPETLGWLEGAYLQPWGVRVRAKLDTGARTSAIEAHDIVGFEKDGKPWVRFRFPYGRREGYPRGFLIERPVVREAHIKLDQGGTEQRYTVELDVCVSGRTVTTEITLADRDNYNYPIILGRRTLAGRFMVDPEHTFLGNRSCPRKLAKQPKQQP